MRTWRTGDLVTRLYEDSGDKIAWFLCSGVFRAYEAAEIARVAAPVYFKYEPGESECAMYKPWITENFHDNHIRQKSEDGIDRP